MDLPTTHQLTTLILQPTRASACPFTLYSGFIAGHICVPAGGGEDAVERFCSVRVAGSDSGSLIRRQTACTELSRLSHSRALGIPIWEDRGLAKRPPPRSRWRPPHGIKSPDCLRGLATQSRFVAANAVKQGRVKIGEAQDGAGLRHGASEGRVTSPYPQQMYLSVHLFRGAKRHVSDPISRRAASDRPAARSKRFDQSRLQAVAFIGSAIFACKPVNAALPGPPWRKRRAERTVSALSYPEETAAIRARR